MKWSPTPYPAMEHWQRDGLRAYMIEHNGWGDLPPITVDEDGNLIDGYKRGEVYSQLAHQRGWPMNAPARVIQGTEAYPDDAERAAKYIELRRLLNSQTIMADEADAWLRGQA